MNTHIQRFCLLLAIITSFPACTTLVVERNEMAMGIDKTVGAGVQVSDKNVLLVTIVDDIHEQLSQGESISRDGKLPPLYARFVASLYRDYGLVRVADWPLTAIGVRCLVFETDNKISESLLQSLRAHRFIDTAQTMNFFSLSGAAGTAYNDPYFELQTGHNQLHVPSTHSWSTGKGVVVAVIDTGIDASHPDLKGRIVGIHNFVDRSRNQFHRDIHGTAVAGVIAANANNEIGIVGVAPDAKILGLKACAQPVTDKAATCNSFTLAKAIDFAIDQRADVINLSLAGPRDDLLEKLLSRAVERGAVVVGAIGRDASMPFPAALADVIAVAEDQPESARHAAVRAPGNQVVSTVPGASYDFFSGSSFSTAYVSGVVALIRQRKPHISAQVVNELLQLTADSKSGYANACDALARIVGGDDCTQNQANAIADRTR